MQDEVNQKVVTLCITGGKISARILKNALVKLLRKMEQMKREQRQAARTSRQQKESAAYHGKQSMEKLMKECFQEKEKPQKEEAKEIRYDTREHDWITEQGLRYTRRSCLFLSCKK